MLFFFSCISPEEKYTYLLRRLNKHTFSLLFILDVSSNLDSQNCLCHHDFCFRFVIVNAGITYLYFSSFQQIDEEEYGGMWELTKEGFMTSFAGFLVRSEIIKN